MIKKSTGTPPARCGDYRPFWIGSLLTAVFVFAQMVSAGASANEAARRASAPQACPPPVITASAPLTVCAGSTGNVASVSLVSGASYAWTISGGTITSGAGTSTIRFTAGSSGTVNLNVTATTVCGSGSATKSVSIVPTPIASITAPADVCPNSTGNAASSPLIAGSSYAWTISNGALTAGQGTNAITFTAGASGSVTLGLTVSSSCGLARNGSRVVPINAPNPTITAPAAVPGLSTGNTASAPLQTGASYTWSISGGSITAGQSTNRVTFSAVASGSVGLGLTVRSRCNVASSALRTIPICTLPAVTASAPLSVCPNSSNNHASASLLAGTTYQWSITGGTITSGGTTANVTFTAGASGLVQLTVLTTNNCGSSTTTKSVSITPVPSTAITAPTTVCPLSTGNAASVPLATGASYLWTITNGTITSSQANSIFFTAGASGSVGLTVKITNSCGSVTSTRQVPTVITDARITAPAKVAALSTGNTASVPLQTGASYGWTITGGAITAGQTTNRVTFSAGSGSSVGLGVTVTSRCGIASSSLVTIPTCTLPLIPIGAPAAVCSKSTGNQASVPLRNGTTYSWTIVNGTITQGAGSNAITFTAGTSGSVQLNAVASNSCGASSQSQSIPISSPVDTTITAPAEVCPNSTGNRASVPLASGMTYLWSLTNATITAGQNTNRVTFTAGASSNVGVSITVTSACGERKSASRSLPVVAAPLASITAPAEVPAFSVGNMASAPLYAGATYSWTISNGTITAGRTSNRVTFSALGDPSVTLGVTIGGKCGLSSQASRAIPVKPLAPMIQGVLPQKGSTTGGTTVTISGTSFQPGIVATFDGIGGTSPVYLNPSTMTTITPAHAAGSVTVTVRNPDGQIGSLGSGYSYVTIDPNNDGSLSGGDVFYLVNTLFAGGTNPGAQGDVNGDGHVNVADIFYLINYLFAQGPPP